MKVLLLHDITTDEPFARALAGAGHEIVRCAEPGRPGFPCDGARGACPLDATVDVAVVVHDRPTTDISPGEAGVICALRDGLPLVVAGNGTQNGFGDRVTSWASCVEDVVSACDRAVAAHRAAAGRRLGGTVEREGDEVRITLPHGSTPRDALRAQQEAKQAFPTARVVDIAVDTTPG